MNFKPAVTAVWLALALAASGGFAVAAEEGDGQVPPPEQSAPAEQQKPPEKPKCVTSNAGFKEKDKRATFEVELINSCDMRLKCTVDAFVIGAKGQVQGHGTLILGSAAKGQTTSKTYVLKVKSSGGMANVSHNCKQI